MKLTAKIFVLFLLAFCSLAKPKGISDSDSSSFPIRIYNIDCKPIDASYVLDHRTHYAQHTIINSRFNFEVKIRIKKEDNSTIQDSSIGVILQTWSGEKEQYVLNPKGFIQKIDKDYYDYVFLFESDNMSFGTCNLVWYYKTENAFGPVNHSIDNVTRNFLLH